MPSSAPDRRRFLALLAAAGTGVATLPPRLGGAVRVDVQVTPLFAQPDAQRCLVRFFVSGLDAPAGRLRVFDERERLIGTAGVVPSADGRLYGELWLAVGVVRHIRTELAAPGLSGPLASWHLPTPAPRWTIYWVPLLPAADLARRLAALADIPRTVLTTALTQAGARLNPLPADLALTDGDVPFLRLVDPALRLAEASHLPLATVAAGDGAALRTPTLVSVLAGSGVRQLVVDGDQPGIYRLEGADGSRLLAAAPAPAADARQLGFFDGGPRMMRQVEQFLSSGAGPPGAVPALRVLTGGGASGVALVTGTAVERLADAAGAVDEWNDRYAYPRIVVGDAGEYFDAVERQYGEKIAAWLASPSAAPAPPTLEQANAFAAARAAERGRRADAMIDCLARLVPGAGRGLAAIARQFVFPIPGTLLFNPSPYARTEVARLADGSERVVTDLPALGYAYVPLGSGGPATWSAPAQTDRTPAVATPQFHVELDPDSGAIRSLVSAGDGREWVAPGSAGLNVLDGAQLLASTGSSLTGVGVRVEAQRRSPEYGLVRTTVTVYEQLPHVDIVNEAEAPGERAVRYHFAFAVDGTAVEWEIPAGLDRGDAPVDPTHLRWLRLIGRGTVYVGALEAATAHVGASGVLTSYAPRGVARYRIAVVAPGGFALPDDPWRFGWGLEPLVSASVPGTGRATLPSFGRLLVVDQPGVAIVGLQSARVGDGVIVYLQELMGQARVATIGAGLLGWTSARLVDLVERDIGAPAMTMVNGAGVALKARGVAALALSGLRLAGG